MQTTDTDTELLRWARGIISDPDPNTDLLIFNEFACYSQDGNGSIADPDESDSWGWR